MRVKNPRSSHTNLLSQLKGFTTYKRVTMLYCKTFDSNYRYLHSIVTVFIIINVCANITFFLATPKTCSCFSIHEEGVTWPDARKSCQYHGGDLVSIETEHEWQVLKGQIENRTNRFNNSWYIGLRMKSRGIWTWVSGKPLTLNQWHGWKPRDGAPYAVMTKTFSPGTKGFFRNVKGSIFAGFICEKPVGKWT